MKSWKKRLKTFPDESPSLSEETKTNFEEIKQAAAEIKKAVYEKSEQNQFKTDEAFKVFAELLKTARELKNEKLLLICRNINKIDINEQIALVDAENSVIEEIAASEEIYMIFKKVFSKFNLGINIVEKFKKSSVEQELALWLGKTLKIEN